MIERFSDIPIGAPRNLSSYQTPIHAERAEGSLRGLQGVLEGGEGPGRRLQGVLETGDIISRGYDYRSPHRLRRLLLRHIRVSSLHQ